MLKIKDMNSNNVIRQGDSQPREYQLDAGNLNLNLANKQATIRLMTGDYRGIAYETTATVSSENKISFSIDDIIPAREYRLEITVDDYVFPSRATDGRFDIDPSSHGQEVNIIQVIGKDEIVREVKEQIEPFLGEVEQAELDRQAQEEARETAEGERQEEYQKYGQQFTDVITELSEEKDYHSLPEIAGARGGFDTLGDRLNETTAQLAHKPLYLADLGVSTARTPEENTTIIQQAITSSNGRPIVFPWTGNDYIHVSGRLTTSEPTNIIGFGKQTKIKQNLADVTFDIRHDNSHVSDLWIEGGGDGRGYHGVYITSNGSSARRLFVKNLEDAVRVASEDPDTEIPKETENNIVEDIETDGVNFGLVVRGCKNFHFNNIRGSYKLLSSKAPHLVYFSGDTDNQNINVTGGNCNSYDGETSFAYQFKNMVDGQVNDLNARKSNGLLNIMESKDFTVKNVKSTQDTSTSALYGSLEVDGECDNVIVDGVEIQSDNESKLIRLGDNVSNTTVKNIKGTANISNYRGVVYLAEIRGVNNTFENIDIGNIGSSEAEASIGIWGGENNKIINPRTLGNETGIIIRAGEGHSVLDYDIDDIKYTTRRALTASSILGDVTIKPKGFLVSDRVIAYDKGELPEGSGSFSHLTSSGHKWIPDFGEWRVYNKRIAVSNGAANSFLYIDTDVNDIEMDLGIKVSNREAVGIRASDRRNLIAVRLHTAVNKLQIAKREESSVETVLASLDITFQIGRRYRVKVQSFERQIDVFLDNEKVLSHTLSEDDYNRYKNNTFHGLLSNGSIDGLYDNIYWRRMD